MRVRALDVNGDWEYGKGQNDYKVDRDAVAQNIQTRLNCFLGDCFFDTTAGIDWFLFLGGKNQLGLNLAISATILNTQFVDSMVQLSIDLNHVTRRLTIKYAVTTTFGTLVSAILSGSVTQNILTEDGFSLLTEGGTPIVTE